MRPMSVWKDLKARTRAVPAWTALCALAAASALSVGCGGSQPAPEAANPAPAEEPEEGFAAAEEPEEEEGWGDADGAQASGDPGEDAAEGSETVETRTTEVLQKVVAEKRAAVRACYDEARKKNSALPGGEFVLRIVIDPEGAVKSVEPDYERSTVKSPDLTNCAVAEVQTWKFPPSSRGMETKLNYPFNFKP